MSALHGPLFATAARHGTGDATLEFVVLGSSSAGNTSFLRVETAHGARQLLIDGGLSPKATRGFLALLGHDLAATDDLLFTHFDHDHAKTGWSRAAMKDGLRLRCSSRHVAHARARGYPDVCIDAFDAGGEGFSLGEIRVIPCENPHDDGGTVAFRIETPAGSVGFATDLGRASDALVESMRGVDILAIESNYDRAMQLDSPRPAFLKDRIMGGKGHLSNDECIDAVRAIAWPREPEHVVLLHLSRECNCPDLVRRLWREALPSLESRLTIARPFEPIGPIRLGQGGNRVESRVESRGERRIDSGAEDPGRCA
jgi:phosphoribosyl 1,2-cyclic phosphodiesterase